MARVTHVKAARNDIPSAGIKAGEPYYWWKFKRGSKQVSKTPPRRSQLTQSAFYGAVYDLEDDVIANASADDSLPSLRDDVVSRLQEIMDETQERLDNMPESLQQGPTGELLQERIDAMQNAMDEFEGLELDEPGEDELEEYAAEVEREENDSDESYAERLQREGAELYWQAKLEEFQGISIDAP